MTASSEGSIPLERRAAGADLNIFSRACRRKMLCRDFARAIPRSALRRKEVLDAIMPQTFRSLWRYFGIFQ